MKTVTWRGLRTSARGVSFSRGPLFVGAMRTTPGLTVNFDVDRLGLYASLRVWRFYGSTHVSFTGSLDA